MNILGGTFVGGTVTDLSHVTTGLQLYFNPSNLNSYRVSGTTITDLSNNALSGTMSNLTYTSPYFTYNGTNSQISIPDNVVLEPGTHEAPGHRPQAEVYHHWVFGRVEERHHLADRCEP